MALYCASPFLIQPVSADFDFAILLGGYRGLLVMSLKEEGLGEGKSSTSAVLHPARVRPQGHLFLPLAQGRGLV